MIARYVIFAAFDEVMDLSPNDCVIRVPGLKTFPGLVESCFCESHHSVYLVHRVLSSDVFVEGEKRYKVVNLTICLLSPGQSSNSKDTV